MKIHKYLNSIISLIIFVFFFSPLLSQEINILKNNSKNPFSFPSTLNLRNLLTSQSFSVTTYYNSQTKKSQYLTNFCNTINYKFSPKLNMRLDLNVVSYGNFNTIDRYSLQANTKILPNFQLDYFPNENFHLRISYDTFPTVFSPYQSIFPNEKYIISDIE